VGWQCGVVRSVYPTSCLSEGKALDELATGAEDMI